MAYQTVRLQPGINTDMTPALNSAGWSDSNLIRWSQGLPEKLGGWHKYIPVRYNAPPRALLAWQADVHDIGQPESANQNWLAVGTSVNLSVVNEGVSSPITPETRTQDITPGFTTAGPSPGPVSSLVTVTATASNLTQYSSVNITTPVSVGGLILYGPYSAVPPITANSFTINAGNNATSTITNGGAVPVFGTNAGSSIVDVTLVKHGGLFADGVTKVGRLVDFQIPTTVGGITISGVYPVYNVTSVDVFGIITTAVATSTASAPMNTGKAHLVYYITSGPTGTGVGWGGTPSTGWGQGAWGIGLLGSTVTHGTPITSLNWTLANWGTILLACRENGEIFYWQPNSGFTNASLVGSAPVSNHGIFIAMPQRMLVAYGSTIANVHDPLQVNWSDVDDFFIWQASSTNQAGGYRIPEGNQIVGGLQASQRALLFTDISVWSMDYVEPPLVWGFNRIAYGCGLIGKHAVTQMFGIVYWMSQGNFFQLDGNGVRVIPCPVWDRVFQDLNFATAEFCVAGAAGLFNEVFFFYPSISGGTGLIDSYAKFSPEEGGIWDVGSMSRTAWIDQSVLGNPIGGDENGLVFQHEDAADADGVAMNPYITSGWFMLTEGDPVTFIDLILPDMKFGLASDIQDARVQFTIETRDWPGSPVRTWGPYTYTETTKFINTRVRGRMMRMTISSSDPGSFWRLGAMRYRGSVDGRRGN